LRFALLSEGGSDQALLPILSWVLRQHLPAPIPVDPSWVDTDRLPWRKVSTPREKLRSAVEVYPCEVLFIHRDEDGSGWEKRRAEINSWLDEAQLSAAVTPIPVIPIRMSEAWLLIDVHAVREAAGNPRGSMQLHLPKVHEIEGIADPKALLFAALAAASGLSGRKLKKFDRNQARLFIAEYMTQQVRLRELEAFRRVEEIVRQTCAISDWA
jgi:hypothetical protein